MNVMLANNDLTRVLPGYQRFRRHRGKRTWRRHSWRTLPNGAFDLLIEHYPLPSNARPGRTNVKIEGRQCLYDPTGNGRVHFYRNVCVGDLIEVRVPGTRDQWGKLPRLHDPDSLGWRFLCFHPQTVRRGKNILSLLRNLDLFISTADPRVW